MSREKRKKIRLLGDGFGNSAGEIVIVQAETENEYYYSDGFGRWVYVYKPEAEVVQEGIVRENKR